MRGLVFAIAAIVVVIVIARALRGLREIPVGARRSQRNELVKDPVCQTYVVASRAVTAEVDGEVAHFCSRECAARYARGERRR